MKRMYISALAVAASIVFALVGCTTTNFAGTSADAAASSAVEQSAAASSGSADAKQASSARPSSSSMPPEFSSSSSMPPEGFSSSLPPDMPQDMQQQGGMNGGGMDTMPGETTDKGYTATDTGIAITTTLKASEAFTERDLAQAADTANAKIFNLESGKDLSINEEGVYVVSGAASESTIVVEASDTAKVQIVLNGVQISNTDFPAIYVKSADKVFVTLEGENSLEVTGDFVADGETETDAVIFSKDDLCLNGSGSLTINSSNHAVVSKDDLVVTGGSYTINAANGSAFRANDSVRIAAGNFDIKAADGLKAKNDDDNELGYVYIKDGSFNITTTDNCIQGYAFVWIDGGSFQLAGAECIEGTYIQINGGKVNIESSEDGINASIKSSVYTPTIEITGGEVNVKMASGDTDALDSNGYLYISGGKVNIDAQFAFDYSWGGEMTGGEVYVNGEQVTQLTESMMGGRGFNEEGRQR